MGGPVIISTVRAWAHFQEHLMERTLTLFKPTGHLTLGNYLGAMRRMIELAREKSACGSPAYDCFYGVADLHALTVPHDPATLRELSRELAITLAALDPGDATLFRQSRVPAHHELAGLLQSVATTGELGRMIQFKEKGRGRKGTRCALFTYPVLMAADILLYRAGQVPVGEDQRQHLELTRSLAQRFNRDYGEVFVVPQLAAAPSGARVMNLLQPTDKMGKTDDNPAGIIFLLDPPEVIRRKLSRAVTDSETGPNAIRADRNRKPGVTNLLEILHSCGGDPEGLVTYADLKAAVADAVVAELAPIQMRYAELSATAHRVDAIFARGEERCRSVTTPVLERVRELIGLC